MRYVILAVVAAALGAGVWWYLRGPDLPPPPVLPAEVTYICRESGALLRLPRQSQYTYNYRGVSQTLDYILSWTKAPLMPHNIQTAPINADFPVDWSSDTDHYYHSSDHDPLWVELVAAFPRVFLPAAWR